MEKIAVALSGGKDSLSLLYLLHAISGRGFPPFQLYAKHPRRTRVLLWSWSTGIIPPFDLLRPRYPLYHPHLNPKVRDLGCYRCSRERRSLIFDAAKEVGAHTIAFGHHRDDSIETLLMASFTKESSPPTWRKSLCTITTSPLSAPSSTSPKKSSSSLPKNTDLPVSLASVP